MNITRCPACGARMHERMRESGTASPKKRALVCDFCHYEYHAPTNCAQGIAGASVASCSPVILPKDIVEKSVLRLHKVCPNAPVHVDHMPPSRSTLPPDAQPLPHNTAHLKNLDAILSVLGLIYEEDLNHWFRQRYQNLRKGGVLMMLVPVKGRFGAAPYQSGQRHVFGPRSLMYLLERHGFKLYWKSRLRKNPLCLIARKM